MDYSHIAVIGRIVHAPEVKYTDAGMALCKFTVACGRYQKDKTDFYDCVAFKERAEFIGKYLDKGGRVQVAGRLEIEPYEDKDGIKKKRVQIIVSEIHPIDWKQKDKQEENWLLQGSVEKPTTKPIRAEEDDDDLPF